MKKLIFLNIIFIAFLFVFTNQSLPQDNTTGLSCGTTIKDDGEDLMNIPNKTPGDGRYLRALIIYVNFPWWDTNSNAYTYSVWAKPTRDNQNPKPINKYPTYTNGKLIWDTVGDKSTIMNRYPDYTISDFFCEMSMGQLDLIGDEYNIVLPHSSLYYKDTAHYDRSSLNRYVLEYLNQTQTIDWTRYDKWTQSGSTFTWGADGTAEMVMINYREIPNNSSGWFWDASWGGEASLAISTITFGSVSIGSDNGITALNMFYNTTHSELILEHEFAHKLFGYSFSSGCHVNLGMMTPAHGSSIYVMSPMERANTTVSYITNPTAITSTGTYTLGDYVETGGVLKILIPGTTSDYYWLANHQKKSVYDGVSRGGKTCYSTNFAEQDPYCSKGKGLYIYREGSNCSNFNQPYDIVSSEGKFNWNVADWVYVPYQNYHHHMGCDLPTFVTTTGDRIYGKDTYQKTPSSSTGYGELIIDNICSSNDSDIYITWGIRGDGKNAFNVSDDEIFSPYSNPSTCTGNNSTNTGLTIKLISQNQSTGAIQLKIYYNDNDLAISECAPAKPKNFKVTEYDVDPGVSFYPKLDWDANIEPDFIGYDDNYYKIYRGINHNCPTESQYSCIATVDANTTEYIDYSMFLYTGESGTDNCPTILQDVHYKISAVDIDANESVKSNDGLIQGYLIQCNNENQNSEKIISNIEIPKIFDLSQNYPNPFNPVTQIKYDLPKDVFVSIKIYDLLGREIKTLINEYKQAGSYIISFNGTEFASGVYFYKIKAGDFVKVKRMVLIK
jgi:hypothetical protein